MARGSRGGDCREVTPAAHRRQLSPRVFAPLAPRAKKAAREVLRGLIVYVANNKGRMNYQAPWDAGLAVGSGSVEGACKHLVQSRFKRAGMRWKTPGFLSVVELRVARLNGTDQEFWANRGLVRRFAA